MLLSYVHCLGGGGAERWAAPRQRGGNVEDLSNRPNVEHWLKSKSCEVSTALAARAALRFAPLLLSALKARDDETPARGRHVVLPVFRALASSWAVAKYPARRADLLDAVAAAVEAAEEAARISFTNSNSAAEYSAYAAVGAARAASSERVSSAAEFAASVTCAHDRADTTGAAKASIADFDLVGQGLSAAAMASHRLWPIGIPKWARNGWIGLDRMLLTDNQDWRVWTDWYAARLQGAPPNETVEIERVMIPREIWERGPRAVNPLIVSMIKKPEASDEPEASDDEATYDNLNWSATRFTKQEDIKRWLYGKPRDIAVVFAARATLRVAPLLVTALGPRGGGVSSASRDLILPALRAMSAAWVAAQYATNHGATNFAIVRTAAAGAAAFASVVSAPSAAAAVADSAVYATSAASDAYDTVASVASAVSASADARALAAPAAKARAAIYAAAASDARCIDRGLTAAAMASRPLWASGTPEWARDAWKRLRTALLREDQDWKVWTEWYSARLDGRPSIEALEIARMLIGDEIWDEGPRAVNAQIGRLIEEYQPLADVPSAFGFGWTDAGTIALLSSPANRPVFPLPTSEEDHRKRLDTCRILAQDIFAALENRKYQARSEYAGALKKYVGRLPDDPGSGNILLADAEARTLRNIFAAESDILSPGLASQLKTFLEQHIGLRPYYPEISKFYQDVQSGRIETPLPQDAVEGFVRGVRDNTPNLFDPDVIGAVEGGAQATTTLAPPLSPAAQSIDNNQPLPPADPLKELNQKKASDFTFGGIVNSLWRVYMQGEQVSNAAEGWEKAGATLQPYAQPILHWLRLFVGT